MPRPTLCLALFPLRLPGRLPGRLLGLLAPLVVLLLTLLVALTSCGGGDRPATSDEGATRPAGARTSSSPGESGAEEALVLFLGDSLTAGYGLDEGQAFPAVVGELLRAEGVASRVVNAGVSGDTTAGGLARLGWLLRQQPDVVVVALGANDGLRGLDLGATEENLRQIIEGCRGAGAKVILAGMLLPPNYGPDYTRAFAELYPRLAEELGVELIPFLLDGVAADPELNLGDGIHPNAEGQRRVAANVVPFVIAALGERR